MPPSRSTTRIIRSKSICGAMCARPCVPVSESSLLRPRPGLFPPQLGSGVAVPPAVPRPDEVAPASPQTVMQGYAHVLQSCLGRRSQTRFDLAGVKLHADVEAGGESLGRGRRPPHDLPPPPWHPVLR